MRIRRTLSSNRHQKEGPSGPNVILDHGRCPRQEIQCCQCSFPVVIRLELRRRLDHSDVSMPYALLNCSFRKNTAKPMGTATWNNSATQNHAPPSASLGLTQKFGKTSLGPILSGAVALATIVVREPRICAAMSVKRT